MPAGSSVLAENVPTATVAGDAKEHASWCDRFCFLEHTHATCDSCVQPSFASYMARVKASELRAREGWGIHIAALRGPGAGGSLHSPLAWSTRKTLSGSGEYTTKSAPP